MLNRFSPLEHQQREQQSARNRMNVGQQAQDLFARCKNGDQDACLQLQTTEMGALLGGGQPAGQLSQRLAEGGESDQSLLSMPTEPGDMDELMAPDPYLPLYDILGKDGTAQFQQAMEDYPIVQLVADMAIKTGDGLVEGEGGPKDDTVPANLSDGEYVISAEAVDVIGLENLEKMHEAAKNAAASQ